MTSYHAKKYSCQIYYAARAFIIGFPIFMAITIMLMLLGVLLKIPAGIGVIIVIIFWVSPFFFEKRIKKIFTRKALLEFNNDCFSVAISKLGCDEIQKTLTYEWGEIKAYKFYFTPSKLTYLDIYLKNGVHKEFGFKDDKTEEESIKSESVFSIFYSFIKEYNSDKKDVEKIKFLSGVFATKKGVILLCVLASLIIIDITLHILKYDSNIGFLIFGGATLLGLIVKRKQQQNFYKRMSDLT
ncbi:MAG: hypothetical protein ABJA35_15075 [Parafilimonas sp.]